MKTKISQAELKIQLIEAIKKGDVEIIGYEHMPEFYVNPITLKYEPTGFSKLIIKINHKS